MWIERPPLFYRWLFPGVIFRMPPSGRNPGDVYITFDDGPIPDVTPWVLDTLDDFGVKATFFMVGENARRYPELLEDVRRRGHAIGNHTQHHIRGLKYSPSEYMNDVEEARKAIGSQIVRPPHGYLTPGQLKALKKKYMVVMHDLVTRDYSKKLTSGKVVENVKKYSRDGSIIVFHDSLKSYQNLKGALPQVLAWLKDKGFSFRILERL